jgi:hypothetical protein
MNVQRAIYIVMLVVSVSGIGYAALFLSRITAASGAQDYSPESAQYFLIVGFGLLFASTLVGAIAVIGLLRQSRR